MASGAPSTVGICALRGDEARRHGGRPPGCVALGERAGKAEHGVAGACRPLVLNRRSGPEHLRDLVKRKLAARLRKEMDRGRPASGHQEGVAGNRTHPERIGGEAHGGYALPALNLVNCGLGRNLQACRTDSVRQRSRRVVAQIRDQFDLDPGVAQVERRAIGAVVRGDEDDAFTDFDAVLVQIATRRVGEHDARSVVVGEDQRTLDRPRGQHDFTRPHLPQPLARQVRVGDELGFNEPFAQPDEILSVIAECLRTRLEPNVRRAAQRSYGVGEPLPGALAIDASASLSEQRTARR